MTMFGLIGGKMADTFAETINRSLDSDSTISHVWYDIPAAQREIYNKRLDVLNGIAAILILDNGFTETTMSGKFGQFNLLQGMFNSPDFLPLGIHLIYYTRDLPTKIYFEKNLNAIDSSYQGAMVLQGGDAVPALISVLNMNAEPLLMQGQTAVDENKRHVMQTKKEKHALANGRRFYTLLGKREALMETRRVLDQELADLDGQLIRYALEINDSNSDILIDTVGEGAALEMTEWLKGAFADSQNTMQHVASPTAAEEDEVAKNMEPYRRKPKNSQTAKTDNEDSIFDNND